MKIKLLIAALGIAFSMGAHAQSTQPAAPAATTMGMTKQSVKADYKAAKKAA